MRRVLVTDHGLFTVTLCVGIFYLRADRLEVVDAGDVLSSLLEEKYARARLTQPDPVVMLHTYRNKLTISTYV